MVNGPLGVYGQSALHLVEEAVKRDHVTVTTLNLKMVATTVLAMNWSIEAVV